MQKKRASAESNDEDQTKEGSESLSQIEDKRLKLDSVASSDMRTTIGLQDLPTELLQLIIIEAVVMEVKGLKLAKSVWEAKAKDLVNTRLRNVCTRWSDLLSTKSFQKELHRTIDSIAQVIRLEVLHESTIPSKAIAITSLKDEIFMLCLLDESYMYVIEVYDRSNMEVAKAVIHLPACYNICRPICMVPCNVTNCVYVGLDKIWDDPPYRSVFRISKDAEHQFKVSPWKSDDILGKFNGINVCANGSVLTYTIPDEVSIYHADGSKQYEISLKGRFVSYHCTNLIPRSNGNVVLSFVGNNTRYRGLLLEIDTDGKFIRKHTQLSLNEESLVSSADDDNGRIMITEPFKRMHLLDSEFNLMGSYSLEQDEGKSLVLFDQRYDRERNEIVRIHFDENADIMVLTVFRFIEE